MERNLNKELEAAMYELGYAREDIPKEFLQEKPQEEFHYVLKGGGLYEE